MSLHQIKVNTKSTLDIVKQNKEKHDVILSEAISGFWNESQKSLKRNREETLKQMKQQYQKSVKSFKKQIALEMDAVAKKNKNYSFQYMKNRYPEDHTDDYNGVIRKLELTVGDTVELDNTEFEQYVRNRWSWRTSFLATNSSYISPTNIGSCVSSSLAFPIRDSSYFMTSSYSVGSAGLRSEITGGIGQLNYLSDF